MAYANRPLNSTSWRKRRAEKGVPGKDTRSPGSVWLTAFTGVFGASAARDRRRRGGQLDEEATEDDDDDDDDNSD